jgi:hypothetical protein
MSPFWRPFPCHRWMPLLPRNRRLHVVVGAPLPPAEKGVTLEQHHKRYVTLVQQLYRAHAHECYGKEQPELQVW